MNSMNGYRCDSENKKFSFSKSFEIPFKVIVQWIMNIPEEYFESNNNSGKG